MPDAAVELARASADIQLTRDAREILERAIEISSARGEMQTPPLDVLAATLQLPNSLADQAMRKLGVDAKALAAQVSANGSDASPLPLRQLLVNANREAQVLGHYQVDSIHLLLAMLYSDTPSTAAALQKAGVTLYDVRQYLQTGDRTAGLPSYRNPTRPDQALRRRPWPSVRGVLTISPVFLGILATTAVTGSLLWTGLLPNYVGVLTIVFVVFGWIASLCLHEFGHSLVAYLGGDRSVVASGYLTLNPLRYTNVLFSLIQPIAFLLLGGIALPGGAVYINHSALRSRVWDSAVSIAGPFANLICLVLVAIPFLIPGHEWWINSTNVNFFAALAVLGFFQALAVVLNLLPVPGLDGFGIVRPWLSYSLQYASNRYSTIGVYGVFIALWFVPPVRDAFFTAVLRLTQVAHIDQALIFFGQYHMQFHPLA
jgi:Zn-dependent protease